MQTDESGKGGEMAASGEEGAAGRFRLPPRTMLLAGAGALVLLLVVAGGVWSYLSSSRQAAAEARARAEQRAGEEAARAVASAPENLERLEAARKAHEDIMAGAALSAPVPASLSPTSVVPETEPVMPASPAARPALSAVETIPAPSSPRSSGPSVQDAQPSVANDAAPLGPDGCTLSGKDPKDFGTALGRCLEEFNRMEAGMSEANAVRRPRR